MSLKHHFLLSLLCIAVSISLIASPQAAEVSKSDYVAVVNGQKVSRIEFDRTLDLVKSKYEEMGRSLQGDQLRSLETSILENMIEKQLLLEESRTQKIDVDPELVESELQKIKSKFADQEQFEDKIREMGYSEDALRKEIEENLSIRELIDQKVAGKIKITDGETRNYYDSNKENYNVPEQIHARHILIKASPNDRGGRGNGAKKEIEEIQAKLDQGADFPKLAKEYSECPSSKNGGDLGYFRRGQMVEQFDNAAFVLKPGEVSDIVETRFGFHLIKVEDRKPRYQKSYDEVKDIIHEELQRQRVVEELKPYMESLKQKYPVERNLAAD